MPLDPRTGSLWPLQSIHLRVECENTLLVQFDGMVAVDELARFSQDMFAVAGRRLAATLEAANGPMGPLDVRVTWSLQPGRVL
jgi:hypothetical protein